jgi:hypothetical protein
MGYWSSFINATGEAQRQRGNDIEQQVLLAKLREFNDRKSLRDMDAQYQIQELGSKSQLLPVQTQHDLMKAQYGIDSIPQDQQVNQMGNQVKSMQYDDLIKNFPNDANLKRLVMQSQIAKNLGGGQVNDKPVWSAENGAWAMPPDAQNPQGRMVQPQGMGINKKSPEYVFGLKDLAKDQANEAQLSKLEEAYNTWKDLNSKVETGPITGMRPVSFNPDFQQLQQLQSYLAMNNFKPGQGQMSNMERGLIKQSGPNVIYDPETNKAIIDIQLGGVQNLKDKNAYREWYLEKNGKLLGADKAWNDYVEKNPRFIKDPTSGQIVPNPNRKEWTDAFGVGGDTQQQGAPAQSGSAAKTIVRTGTINGRKVNQYSDGSVDYGD